MRGLTPYSPAVSSLVVGYLALISTFGLESVDSIRLMISHAGFERSARWEFPSLNRRRIHGKEKESS